MRNIGWLITLFGASFLINSASATNKKVELSYKEAVKSILGFNDLFSKAVGCSFLVKEVEAEGIQIRVTQTTHNKKSQINLLVPLTAKILWTTTQSDGDELTPEQDLISHEFEFENAATLRISMQSPSEEELYGSVSLTQNSKTVTCKIALRTGDAFLKL